MAKKVSGVVGYVSNGTPFRNKTLYSFKIEGDDTWYGCGEDKPAFDVGAQVSFECSDKNNVFAESLEIKEGEAPTKAPAPKRASGGARKSGGMSKDDYWRNKEASDVERQKTINFQSSRKDAIEIVKMAVERDMLALPKTKAKALDALIAVVQDVTVQMYADIENLDTLVAKPEPKKKNEETEDFDDMEEWNDEEDNA